MPQLAPNWKNKSPTFLNNSGLKKIPRSQKLNSASHPKSKGASHPAHLIQNIQNRIPKALRAMRCRVESRRLELAPKVRLLLIPYKVLPLDLMHDYNKTNRTKPKKSELKLNRKSPSLKGFIIHDGTRYKVNTGISGSLSIYTLIVKRMITQLDISLDKWGRVFAVRLDLHQKFYRGDNLYIRRFFCNFKKRLLKEYGFNEMAYQWARELETSIAQHYHIVLFFNGYKIKSSWKIREFAKDVWERIKIGNTVPYWDSRKGKVSHDIKKDDPQAKADAVYHFSYLAKTKGKGYRDPKANDYGTSQLVKRVRLSV